VTVVVAASDKSDDVVAARLGAALRQARLNAEVSQADLARRLNVIPQQLNRWESGQRRISPETIADAERALKVRVGTVGRLAGYVDDGGLIDVDTLPPWARRSIRALLRQVEQDRSVQDVVRNDGDGSESTS
jgi:transcriptional regulator with XRE-family HTH domain